MRSDFEFGLLMGFLAGMATALIFPLVTQASWLKDWQTLATGGIAIFAAFITVQPARRQLKLMAVQSSIMARDSLAARLRETKTRGATLVLEVNKLLDDWRRAAPFGDHLERKIEPEWAFDAEKAVTRVRDLIRSDRLAKNDPAHLDESKVALQKCLSALSKCLRDIHFPDSADLADPARGHSDQERSELQAELDSAAEIALNLLGTRYSDVDNARIALRQAYAARVADLRRRLRAIDDLIDERSMGDREGGR
ncbi:hypothetical protein [Hyphomicrobium sp. CS1GBMeth3]|uniref:hypothetical protein n=1 Tax=Hyphomicrobium sp. CS1GBMeth3 TaxID=1892845 RepID=UPI0009307685|nr:hypothetical protein [Hyphomicrobium sp. CS1GBMeth3]